MSLPLSVCVFVSRNWQVQHCMCSLSGTGWFHWIAGEGQGRKYGDVSCVLGSCCVCVVVDEKWGKIGTLHQLV